MERLIIQKLRDWKNETNRKPLIIRGARQIGKSYSIVEFGKQYFNGHVINFEKNPELKTIFEYNFDTNRIISELEIFTNRKITAASDLIFFDEIQECPKALVALRYFYEQSPQFHVIAAGSLLEFALKDISFPVGRVHLLNMTPMNFYEYLLAIDKPILAKLITEEPRKLSDAIHKLLQDELKNYFIIGGMPECVKTYAETKRLSSVFDIQSDLISTFRQDFSKYAAHSDKDCLNNVLSSVAKNIGFQVKYANLTDGFANPTIKKAFTLLETARLFKKIYSSTPEGLPLGANIAEKTFKAIMLDIGLLSRMNGFATSTEFAKTDLLSIFRGAIAEQFVGQELISAGNTDLYYWSRQAKNSTAEVDFLIENKGNIIPIEVKSGSSGRLRSMHILLDTYSNVQKGIVYSDAPFGEITDQKLHFYPLYYTYFTALNS